MVVFNAQYSGDKDGMTVGWEIKGGESTAVIKANLLLGYDCYVTRKAYKKVLWDDIRFPEDFAYEDVYVNIPLLRKAAKIISLPNKLYFYEQKNMSSITKSNEGRKLHDFMCALVHALRLLKKEQGNEAYYTLYKYRILSMWARWGYQCFLSRELERFQEETLRLLAWLGENELAVSKKWDTVWLQTNYYAFWALENYEGYKLLSALRRDAEKAEKEKDFIRYTLRALCLDQCTKGLTESEKSLLWSIVKSEKIPHKYLRLNHKILLHGLLNRITWIVRLEGSHLIGKDI